MGHLVGGEAGHVAVAAGGAGVAHGQEGREGRVAAAELGREHRRLTQQLSGLPHVTLHGGREIAIINPFPLTPLIPSLIRP